VVEVDEDEDWGGCSIVLVMLVARKQQRDGERGGSCVVKMFVICA